MVTQMVRKASNTAAAQKLAEQSPTLVLFIIMAGGFLYAQERRDKAWHELLSREDKVTEMRIEECHRVQIEASEAMKSVAEALNKQASAFDRLTYRFDSKDFE